VRKGIEIMLGTTISLPFTLSQGKTEIVVTAAAPVIDVKKTEVGANISDQMISSIPLGRNSAGIAFLSPGAVTSGLADTPSIAGASGPENSYTVNGVEVTGSGDGLNLTTLNFDFIEATEVKTGGMDAEFGALMGGNITSITKSGGNEFHGSLFAYYFDDGLGASERKLKNENVVNYRKNFKQYDFGGSLGGYFIKDKLWFFVAYDYNKTESGYTANGSDGNVLLNGQPSYSWARTSGYTNKDTDPQFAVKLTWNVNPNHKLSLSYFGDNDKYNYYRNINNISPIPAKATDKTDNWALSLQWNATWTPKFFTEIIVSRRNTDENLSSDSATARNTYRYYYRYGSGTYAGYQIIPTGPPNSYTPATRRIDLGSYQPSTGGTSFQNTKDVNDQLRLKGTNLFSAAGRHELSYGIQYYDIKYDYEFNYTGPGVTNRHTQLYDPASGQYIDNPFLGLTSPGGAVVRWHYTGSAYRFRPQYFLNDQYKKTKQQYTAYWIQDNWNITDYFMLKVGVRLDQIHMKGGNNSINVPATIMPQGGPRGPFSNGIARKVNINDMWAPRIGFTWDVAHNNKSKLYGFFGQYYERIPNDMAIRALTDEYFTFEYFSDPQLTTPASISYAYGLYPTKIQNGPKGGGLKGSYNEEWLLGFQYEIRPDFSVGARAIYRSLGRAIEDISNDGGQTYIVTNPDQWTGQFSYLPRNGVYGWYNYPKPTRIYKALEITADKRFSNNWMLQGSYVLSRLEGNYEGLFSNDNGQLDPNITSKYDLPQLLVDAYGILPNDRTHVLKVFGGYFFPNFPLELSGNFTLQSGTVVSKLGADDYYGTNEGFCAPRGTAGRLPTLWTLDLGIQYTFKLWTSNLALRADIFNVTNEQRTTAVDQTYNNVDVQNVQNYPYFKKETAHQAARRIRLAIRWTF
jgi:hypothetical protein